jgi:hypothetical protein
MFIYPRCSACGALLTSTETITRQAPLREPERIMVVTCTAPGCKLVIEGATIEFGGGNPPFGCHDANPAINYGARSR